MQTQAIDILGKSVKCTVIRDAESSSLVVLKNGDLYTTRNFGEDEIVRTLYCDLAGYSEPEAIEYFEQANAKRQK